MTTEQADLTSKADAPTFPIVAVGASAGGLAPTSELLRQLGDKPGLAVVVIHHLDPTHESGLVEILSRATRMPVVAASEGLRAAPNHVYVVPPNAGLLIEHGLLKLVPRVEVAGLHLPIDRFFESLALDRNVLAIGVVLSGSGFDGTAGVKALKAEGGMALAQDATAQHGSMPQSAIATGCVDFILPPAGIARELVRLGAHPPPLLPLPAPGALEPEYQQILAMVRRATGVDFTSYKHTTVRRRLQRRMVLHKLTSLTDYLALLQRDPAEVRAFSEEVLIHVTGFFREPEAFAALVATVFLKLCESRPGDAPIRIWVPGCSSGEEVYSIAICLLEYLEATRRTDLPIKIFGTDLSLATVEKARAGTYTESIERDVSPARLQRFFTKETGLYQIRRDVRDLCVFAMHNVAHDPPFPAMDLISCRNVMIYLGPELQDRVIALLHYALKEPGFLMLGSAETVRAFPGFATLDGKNKIYARTSAAPRLAFDFTTPRLWVDPLPPGLVAPPVDPGGARSSSQPDVQCEADRLVLAEFGPPGVVVTDDLAILQFRGQTGPYLEPAPGVASLDLLRMAREEIRLPLRQAIDQARSTRQAAKETGVALTIGETRRTITIEVLPFAVHATQQRFFLVLFEDVTPPEAPLGAQAAAEAVPRDDAQLAVEAQLRQDLVSTRQYLESVIEQLEATNEELKAANEEILSSNEELRSTNEELQSAKEELQATNEELTTVNDEMKERNSEGMRLNDDLTNVLSSVEIPIVILGRDTRIRRFTPAAGKVFGLLGADLTRPIGEVNPIATMVPALARMITEVLAHLQPLDCGVQDAGGRWYHVSVRPYVTLDNRIDGTVITALDIDAAKRGTERLAVARAYAESIIDTVRESLVVIDRELRVRSANKAFQRAFKLAPKAAEGRRLDELGSRCLATPALRELIVGLKEGETVEDFRLEQADEAGALGVLIVNARHIEGGTLILLALDDVTETERAEAALRQAEIGLRDILLHAAEAILMIDAQGVIVFVNELAARLFAYGTPEELTGLSVEVLVPERLRAGHANERTGYFASPSPRAMGLNRELIGLRKDGTEFPVEVVLSPATRSGDRRVVAFVTDTTVKRKAEKSIREYQDKLQRMAFDAALTEERERRRIAVELHDRIGQSLALAQIKLTSTRDTLSGEARSAVDEVVELLKQSAIETRTLTFDLSPPVLYDLGLKDALSWLADEVEKRYGMRIEIADDEADKPMDDATRSLVFRAVRELLMNVFKHAKTPTAKVSLRRSDDHFDIAVEDAGVGFDQEATSERTPNGFGLLSVREQIGRLGGTLQITSAPSHGTRVNMRLPLTLAGKTTNGEPKL